MLTANCEPVTLEFKGTTGTRRTPTMMVCALEPARRAGTGEAGPGPAFKIDEERSASGDAGLPKLFRKLNEAN